MGNLEVLMDIENRITDLIKADNGSNVNFVYSLQIVKPGELEKTHNVKVITQNKITREFFLLVSMYGNSPEDALNKAFEWLQTHKTNYNSYSVIWLKMPDGNTTTSYFYAKDMREVLDKFFDGKDENRYNIFEIKQNPIE